MLPSRSRILINHLFVVLNHIVSSVNELAENHSVAHDMTIYSSSVGHALTCVVYLLLHITC